MQEYQVEGFHLSFWKLRPNSTAVRNLDAHQILVLQSQQLNFEIKASGLELW
jgi:hypothetical protein